MRKAIILLTFTTLLWSCNDHADETPNQKYLGSPRTSDLSLRVIPSTFIEKNMLIPIHRHSCFEN